MPAARTVNREHCERQKNEDPEVAHEEHEDRGEESAEEPTNTICNVILVETEDKGDQAENE